MNSNQRLIFKRIAETLDIPESAYSKAEARYRSLGEWFGRADAKCAAFLPHVSSQGSFRLGTVVRAEEYDLDFTCKLREGVTPQTHSQEDLKDLVRDDMAEYRLAHGMRAPLEAKHRCWRLRYADELSFHMDVVPAIPHDAATRRYLEEQMIRLARHDTQLAARFAVHACAITDDRLPNFQQVHTDWLVSNPEGYAVWFDSRVKIARIALRDAIAGTAEVEDLPVRRANSPLQMCVKILKHHRDLMFADDEERKPISIILTTLAAQAYSGEVDVGLAIENCLKEMERLLSEEDYHVRNPVNPAEDFADKWRDPAYRHLGLAQSFRDWVRRARAEFDMLGQQRDPQLLTEVAGRFGGQLDGDRLRATLGAGEETQGRIHAISEPPRPWSADRDR